MRSFSPAPRSTTASPSTRGPSKRSGAGMEGGGTLWSQAAGLGGRGVWSPPRRCVMLVPRLVWAAAPWLSDFPPSLCALRRWTRRWAGLAVRPPLGGGAPGSHHRQAARSRRIRLEQCVFSTRQTWRTDTDHADAAAKNFGESSSLARTQWGTFSPFRVTIPFLSLRLHLRIANVLLILVGLVFQVQNIQRSELCACLLQDCFIRQTFFKPNTISWFLIQSTKSESYWFLQTNKKNKDLVLL